MKRLIWIALVAALAVGCGDKDGGESAATSPTDPSAGTPAAEAPLAGDTPADDAAPAVVAEEVPTVEDFEEEAAETITQDNLEKELAELEKEIGE